jgi:hypothetical protein
MVFKKIKSGLYGYLAEGQWVGYIRKTADGWVWSTSRHGDSRPYFTLNAARADAAFAISE